jgi:hypothetical protein
MRMSRRADPVIRPPFSEQGLFCFSGSSRCAPSVVSAGRHSRRTSVAGMPTNEHSRHAHTDARMLNVALRLTWRLGRLSSPTVAARQKCCAENRH